MRNCLVTGFGRSGTSLMGGILHMAGYYMGENLYPPRDTNPKGFFENDFINGINERIMAGSDHCILNPGSHPEDFAPSPYRPGYGHRWLSYIPRGTRTGPVAEEVSGDIRKALSHAPYAYKDPRFNYTLEHWLRLMDERAVVLCLFREPWKTIRSVLHECGTAEYLRGFFIDHDLAETLWRNSYLHLLDHVERAGSGRFRFIHYRQLITGEALESLSESLEADLSGDFIDLALDRTRTGETAGPATMVIYEDLCRRAEYKNP